MPRLPRIAPLALAAAALAACTRRPAGPEPSPEPSASVSANGDTLRLMVGQGGAVDGGRLTVRFDSLVADSRCPAGKQCVWAGDASVALRLTTGGETTPATLHTGLEPRATTAGGYTLTLVDVAPYPGTEPPNARLAPVAVLRIARR